MAAFTAVRHLYAPSHAAHHVLRVSATGSRPHHSSPARARPWSSISALPGNAAERPVPEGLRARSRGIQQPGRTWRVSAGKLEAVEEFEDKLSSAQDVINDGQDQVGASAAVLQTQCLMLNPLIKP